MGTQVAFVIDYRCTEIVLWFLVNCEVKFGCHPIYLSSKPTQKDEEVASNHKRENIEKEENNTTHPQVDEV